MKNACVHYWVCGEAEGGKVPAVCKRCGAKTQFAEYLSKNAAMRHYAQPLVASDLEMRREVMEQAMADALQDFHEDKTND